ncbi:MAG TPA: cytochrome P450 [Ktedonobacterales bacterium]|nr:cytochrome P450 [Ktedonobacterales bacterium]
MSFNSGTVPQPATGAVNGPLGLYQLLDPEVLADPYPLYHQLQAVSPVHWDPFLKAWVVTRYADVLTVLSDRRFSARRTPTPDDLAALGLDALVPIAQVMVRQMLFMDPPAHGRIRNLAARAFTPRRIENLRDHIQDIVEALLDAVQTQGRMDVISDLAVPLPAIVTEELLGISTSDLSQLKAWSADFATMLGNFQHNPEHTARVRQSIDEMYQYFGAAVSDHQTHPRNDLISAFLETEHEGDRLTNDEVIANTIMTMVGGQETTTSLIGNGLLTLLRHPAQLRALRSDASLIPAAIEEMLRFESPIQHTARMTVDDLELGGQQIRKRQAVIAVLGAANRDPERFADPDQFDIHRQDNRHVAFGWASHFCFGAPLARLEAHIVFETILRRAPDVQLDLQTPTWQDNLCYRGLTALPIIFA